MGADKLEVVGTLGELLNVTTPLPVSAESDEMIKDTTGVEYVTTPAVD